MTIIACIIYCIIMMTALNKICNLCIQIFYQKIKNVCSFKSQAFGWRVIKAVEPQLCVNVDRKRATGPRCQLPHSLHNMPARLKAHYRSLTSEHTHSSINFCGQRHCESSADWQVNVEYHTGWATEREEKSKRRKKKKGIVRRAMAAIQSPRSMRTIIPLFQSTPSSSLC